MAVGNFKKASFAQKMICFAFLSVFLHYAVTALTIVVLGLFAIIDKASRKEIFSKKSHLLLLTFCILTIAVALFYKNYIGIVCSVVFYLLVIILYFAKGNITTNIFEESLSLCCKIVIPLSVAVAVEKYLNLAQKDYRCKLWFFNANYMTALFAAVVLFCAYKVIENSKQIWVYYISAAFSLIAMYLSGSMFAFIELFVGVCMLLILRKKYVLLAAFFFVVFLGLVILYFNPEIFPRILTASRQTGKRIEIWNTSMDLIKERPIFGQGFLTYYHNATQNPDIYQTTHAHNFALEPLLSFGIVGSALLLTLLWIYFKKVIECKETFKNQKTTALILSLCSAVLIHSTTDMTLMWIQTGLLYVLVLSAVGIEERKLKEKSQNGIDFWEE